MSRLNRRHFLALVATIALGCQAPIKRGTEIDFALPDTQGVIVSPKNAPLAGKPYLLYVFGTWCAPCKMLSPAIQQLHETYGDKGLAVAGVHFDVRGGDLSDHQNTVRGYAEAHHITFPLLIGGTTEDTPTALPGITIKGFPTVLLVGRDGKVKKYWGGYSSDVPREIEEAVRATLAGA